MLVKKIAFLFILDSDRLIGNSKFYLNDVKKELTLEDHFFELECQMENKMVSRDFICRNVEKEKGRIFFHHSKQFDIYFYIIADFLCELVEILLYVLLPGEDFQCKPLRYLLREIFVNGVILPLFNLVSDPDYINQAMLWLVRIYKRV